MVLKLRLCLYFLLDSRFTCVLLKLSRKSPQVHSSGRMNYEMVSFEMRCNLRYFKSIYLLQFSHSITSSVAVLKSSRNVQNAVTGCTKTLPLDELSPFQALVTLPGRESLL